MGSGASASRDGAAPETIGLAVLDGRGSKCKGLQRDKSPFPHCSDGSLKPGVRKIIPTDVIDAPSSYYERCCPEGCCTKDACDSARAVQSVESFIDELLISGNHLENTATILSNEVSRKAFVAFLNSELKQSNKEGIQSCRDIEMAVLRDKDLRAEFATEYAQSREDESSTRLFSSKDNGPEFDLQMRSNRSRKSVKSELLLLKDRLSTKVMIRLIPKFFNSAMYRQWRAEEQASLTATTAGMLTRLSVTETPEQGDEKFSDRPASAQTPSSSLNSSLHSTWNKKSSEKFDKLGLANMSGKSVDESNPLRFLESTEFSKLTTSSSWLLSLISNIENMPIGFALASVDSAPSSASSPHFISQHFPLIHVNAEFEHIFKCSRHEVIGQDPIQLFAEQIWGEKSSDVMSASQIAGLRDSMRGAVSYHSDLGNSSIYPSHPLFTDEPTTKVLRTKPILDQTGACRYVMFFLADDAVPEGTSPVRETFSHKVDEVRENESKSALTLSDRLLQSIPAVINMDVHVSNKGGFVGE
jgi:hypothetical protein